MTAFELAEIGEMFLHTDGNRYIKLSEQDAALVFDEQYLEEQGE